MRKILSRIMLPAAFLLLIGSGYAQSGQGIQPPSPKIPPGFQSLVPEGFTLTSPQTVKYPNNGSVSFIAAKRDESRFSIYIKEYKLELIIMEKPKELVKMQAPMYRQQLEKDIQSSYQNWSQEETSPLLAYGKPQLKRYSWGAGMTQQVNHKYMGAGSKPDEIEYCGIYFGLIVEGRSIKKFKLTSSGVEDRGAVDGWAAKAADIAARTFLSDL